MASYSQAQMQMCQSGYGYGYFYPNNNKHKHPPPINQKSFSALSPHPIAYRPNLHIHQHHQHQFHHQLPIQLPPLQQYIPIKTPVKLPPIPPAYSNQHNNQQVQAKQYSSPNVVASKNNVSNAHSGYKWKSDNPISGIPKKWCDFVFRRNVDNRVYRSESFRFIQKTNSLALPPLSSGLNKYRNKRLRVPVSDDYVEPVDQLQGVNWGECEELDEGEGGEPSYHEILESYNAPYYYSDTIKEEPTYCSPCPSVRKSCRSRSRSRSSTPRRSRSGTPMARKRYETAFLPSTSHHNQSPDVDSLLLAIESSCLEEDERREGQLKTSLIIPCPTTPATNYATSGSQTCSSVSSSSSSSTKNRTDPSILFCQPIVHCHNATSSSSSCSSNQNSPRLTGPSKIMPLSEPLPLKRYSNNIPAPCDKRLMMMLKDNSVSSLESIDSAKSEDLQPLSLSRFINANHNSSNHSSRGQVKCKLLSPISDKSPLEPTTMMHTLDAKDIHGSSVPNQWTKMNLMSAAELTNVPWEMPKLRRKLALLADSGISLDFPGTRESGDRETDSFSFPGVRIGADPQCYSSSSQGRRQLELRLQSDSEFQDSKYASLNVSLDCYEENEGQHDEMDPDCELETEAHAHFHRPADQGKNQELPCTSSSLANHYLGSSSRLARGQSAKPDRCLMKLDFSASNQFKYEIDPTVELETQDWFHGAITRYEAETILRATKEGSFLVRNCESSAFNRYSLSLKSARGFIHIRIEPNSLGTFSLGEQEFPSVPHLVLHFMSHRLPIKGAEHVKLKYPVITQLL